MSCKLFEESLRGEDEGPRDRNYYINKNKCFLHDFVADSSSTESLENQSLTQVEEHLSSIYSGKVLVSCLKNNQKKSLILECYEQEYHIKIIDQIQNGLSEKYVYPLEQLMNFPAVEAQKNEPNPNVDILFAVIQFIRMTKFLAIDFKLKEILIISGIPINNAFWNGYYLSIGCGDGQCSPRSMKPLVSTDIIGHELGHALIEQICNLQYYKDSGALNESFADIIGTSLEYYIVKFVMNPRTIEKIEDTDANWTIGENVLVGGLRNMADPWEHGQPKFIGDKYFHTSPRDFYGVHTNSGIFNYYFYRLTQTQPFFECTRTMINALHRAHPTIIFYDFYCLLPNQRLQIKL